MSKEQTKLNMPKGTVEIEVPVIEEQTQVIVENVKPDEPVNIQHAKVIENLTQKTPELTTKHPAEFVPSNWYLTPIENTETVNAVNTVTGRRLICTIAEFNLILRG